MRYKFPPSFHWGASTSSHQIEGDNRHNDWWRWECDGNTAPSGKACDHYNRFQEDFHLARELGHNAHRLSIEWSRVERQEGEWEEEEWAHYRDVITELKKLGIEPFVTLNHFTLPLWVADKGGWLDPASLNYFQRYAEKAIKELGGMVRYWFTFNEPNILARLAYDLGIWPPCHKDTAESIHVLRNILKAHVLAYVKMHGYAEKHKGILEPSVGIAKAVTAFHPFSRYSVYDRFASAYRGWFHNHSFIVSVIKGHTVLPFHGASVEKKEKLPAKQAMDLIGLNYYFRQFVRAEKSLLKDPMGEIASHHSHPRGGKTTDMGWEIYPRGIYEVIKDFTRYRIPLVIAENGIATNNDELRKKFIKDHLNYVQLALSEKSPVRGYLHWSLLDNFEWAEGYSKRFGLVGVDFETQKRTIKDSGRYLESIIRTRIV